MHRRRYDEPSPTIAEPRPYLLLAVRSFVEAAHVLSGVRRIALVGSLTTAKPVPKDADVLVVIEDGIDLDPLARAGRRLKGRAQQINLGADVFLADEAGRYIGRICPFRECHRRVRCEARQCGGRAHLADDLDLVTLPPELIAAPPLDLWPKIVRRASLPADVEEILLAE